MTTRTEHAVVIVGAGPTGLMLAGELALANVDVGIVERRPSQALDGWRAGGLLPRTLEVLDQRGIVDRFVSEGQQHPVVMFPGITLNISDLPTRHPYWLALWQERFEPLLAAWVEELGVPIHRGLELTEFVQDERSVELSLSDGSTLHAGYLVGCDGGRSRIRKQAGIEFPGWEPSVSYLIAEGEATEEPAWGLRRNEKGISAIAKVDDGKRMRVVLMEPELRLSAARSLDELCAALVAVYGTDFGICNVTFLSRFTDAARQASRYRAGRVLLAGDAAHIHSPAGGQGLNLGVQDAVNLGWKLAQVVKGAAPESLLDTYQAERQPVGARVLEATLAITALNRGDDRTNALREMMAEVMQLDQPRHWYAARMSGLDVRYDLGVGHPLLGRRMPDLDLVTDGKTRRVFSLLHEARPVLLNLATPGAFDVAPWRERVRRVDARSDGAWELPGFGPVAKSAAVLLRPDGHVAWVSDGASDGLEHALTRWVGPGDGR